MEKVQITHISPDNTLALEWRELLDNTELLRYFIWRNFKVRYKQTIIGAAWAIFKPLILMVVFTFAFNKVGSVETGSETVPYPIFAYAGLMFWTFFSQNINQVGTSFVTFQGIINKVYFPRVILPISIITTGIIDFAFSLIIYFGLMAYYGIAPTLLGTILFIPLIIMTSLAILGVGIFAAALNVKYRDVAQVIPFFIQALLFLTPVIYPVSAVPASLQWVLYINPIAGVVDTAQASLLGIRDVQWHMLAISVATTILTLVVGLTYFKAKEREFADLI